MELFEILQQHTSVRFFTDQKIPAELKKKFILAAQSTSSSNFLQAYSIIEISDNQKRKTIEKIANFPVDNGENGTLYLFVADLNKHAQILTQQEASLEHLKSMESLVIAIVDTALAAQSMAVYAESVELGICYVGGIGNDLFAIQELLDLPPLTYPIFGMLVGYPAKRNETKPRLPLEAVVGTNTYQNLTPKMLQYYDQTMEAYYQGRSHNLQTTNWSEKVRQYFAEARRPETLAFLQHQGFLS